MSILSKIKDQYKDMKNKIKNEMAIDHLFNMCTPFGSQMEETYWGCPGGYGKTLRNEERERVKSEIESIDKCTKIIDINDEELKEHINSIKSSNFWHAYSQLIYENKDIKDANFQNWICPWVKDDKYAAEILTYAIKKMKIFGGNREQIDKAEKQLKLLKDPEIIRGEMGSLNYQKLSNAANAKCDMPLMTGVDLDNMVTKAGLGYDQFQYNLGMIFECHDYFKQNYDISALMYKESAKRGNEKAMFKLAQCYENGVGVMKNHKAAIKFYSMAMDYGHAEAAESLEKIKQQYHDRLS